MIVSILTGGLVACSQENGLTTKTEPDVKPVATPVAKEIVIENVQTAEEAIQVETLQVAELAQEVKTVEATEIKSELLFEFDSSAINKDEQLVLQKVAEQMKAADKTTVWQLVGHTDMVGSDEYNERLAQRRANSVKAYLVAEGVDESQLSAISLGKSNPLIPTAESQFERRVMIQSYAAESLDLAVKLQKELDERQASI
jgi:outer membrane protein OmpA-like peptidoglycan-associated protein